MSTSPDERVVQWFERVKLASLELPTGWFGRPHGDLHQLTWSGSASRRIILELDEHLLLMATDPGPVSCDERSLTIPSFAQLVFAWEEFGNRRPHLQGFTTGALRFWAQGSQLP
ncbi:MAG TPA: hypothetical protein VG184_01300 [Acidimicrobiales bacterium]|jgi:hypothetical protein|nr:hypothetical protein [Acidimicrobiales bacterium]